VLYYDADMARSDPQMNIRLPEELKAAIEQAAKANGRSMNAEIVSRLEQSFAVSDKAKAFMDDDPLQGIVVMCEMMGQGISSIASLALKAGTDSGKVKVEEKE